MVTPLALVGHIHPLLALAAGGGDRAVGVQRRDLEELRRLLLPDRQTNLVDRFHQRQNLPVVLEPPAKISGGGRVGNPPGAQGVHIDFVVAAKFQVFQACAAGQHVVGDVQHVVGLVIRQMHLEQFQVAIEGLDQADEKDHLMNGADPRAVQPARAVGHFIVNVARREHGLVLRAKNGIGQTILDSALASSQSFACSMVHSKRLRAYEVEGF